MERNHLGALVPGVAFLASGAVVAKLLTPVIPGGNHLLLAIIIGFLFANANAIPSVAESGIQTHKLWLATGIVLMGASLTLSNIVESGPLVLVVVLSVTTVTLLLVELIARVVFGISDELSSLLAAGSSICGVSAIIAVAGAIKAKEHRVAYATGTILLFDGLTLIAYPIIGEVLAIPAKAFGIWAGVSMFSTGPVVAVGFAHSPDAGQWATITKLTRNTLIGVIAILYAANYARTRTDVGEGLGLRSLWDGFPKFILGFLGVMLIATAGMLSESNIASITNAYEWLFSVAFVGLGTEIKIEKLRNSGVRPILLVLVSFVIVSTVSLLVILTIFA